MKKLALILALIIIPCSAFGLEMLNDNAMDQVTGQSGVSIAVDDVQIFMNIDKMAYIDCDGFNSLGGYGTCSGAGGAIALNNFQIDVLNVNAIVSHYTTDPGNIQTEAAAGYELYSLSCGKIPLFFDYGQDAAFGCYLGTGLVNSDGKGLDHYRAPNAYGGGFDARAISIDVTDALPALTQGKNENLDNSGLSALVGRDITVGGVLIGIPTMEIYIQSMSLTAVYDGDISGHSSLAMNDDNSAVPATLGYSTFADFGTIELQGITFTTLSGWIEIAPH